MSGPPDPDNQGAEDAQARRWLSMLQMGSPDEKAGARRGLARIFEDRGMLAEAAGLLETNAREGYRDDELYRALARLHRALGDEHRAASAALEATRLRGRQSRALGSATSDDGPGSGPRGPRREPESPAPPSTE